MKTALLLNDTSRWHQGSAASVFAILEEINRLGYRLVDSRWPRVVLERTDFEGIDLVVINGEGSMHDDKTHDPARAILKNIRRAKQAGCTVWLVNSLWCRMSDDAAKLVRKCVDYFQVRERVSGYEAFRQNVDAKVKLDASVGQPEWWWMFNDRYTEDGVVYTPFYHGVLAALIGEVPWVYAPPPGINPTHKVSGLCEWLNMSAPTVENVQDFNWPLVFKRFAKLARFALPVEVKV